MLQQSLHVCNNISNKMRLCKVCQTVVRPRKDYTPTICEACQKFFRRNIGKRNDLQCTTGKFNCNIEGKRRLCGKCRIEKCLQSGMKSKLFKMDNKKMEFRNGHVDCERSSDHNNNNNNYFKNQEEDEEEEEIDVGTEDYEMMDISLTSSTWSPGISNNNCQELQLSSKENNNKNTIVVINETLIYCTPSDESFNAAERFLSASLSAYTELSAIDQVCWFVC